MNTPSRVLIVDDETGDLHWLLVVIRLRGYDYEIAANEQEALRHLDAVKAGSETYVLAIIDVGVATRAIEDLIDLDDQVFEDSRDTGIRLCRYARQQLKLAPRDLPIACLTVRDDEEVKQAMRELGIPLYNRAPVNAAESIRTFVEKHLPPRTA